MHGRLALTLAVLGSQAVWADLTIRYQFELTPGPAIPAAAAATVKAQLAGILPGEMAMRVKGDKCTSSFGPLNSIIDTGKGEITLFNPATKQFATVPVAGYMEKVLAQQQVPAAVQQTLQTALQSLKIDVQTKKTGETSTIQGIQAEDNLVIVSIEGPNPAGVPLGFRMEIHEWVATAEELTRNPALSQMATCSARLGPDADPSAIVEKILGPLVGTGGLSDALKGLAAVKGKVMLKTQTAAFAPGIVALLQAQGAPGLAPAGDVNAPLAEATFSLAELSTYLLSDALFQVPAGYQEASLEELLKTIPKPALPQAAPPKPQAPAAAATPINDFTGTAVRPGNGVSNPAVVSQVQPKYDEQARAAKIEGSVLVSLVVDENGVPRNVKVVRSLDPGLDQKAIEAVQQWKFRPGQKDGNPVAVQAQIQVTFKLLDKPPVQPVKEPQ
jgi:TonB family protein